MVKSNQGPVFLRFSNHSPPAVLPGRLSVLSDTHNQPSLAPLISPILLFLPGDFAYNKMHFSHSYFAWFWTNQLVSSAIWLEGSCKQPSQHIFINCFVCFEFNLDYSSDDDGLSKSLLLLKSFSKTLSSPSPRGPIFYGKSKLHLRVFKLERGQKYKRWWTFLWLPYQSGSHQTCFALKLKGKKVRILSLQNGYDKVSANIVRSVPKCYKKSDVSQDARREYPDMPN